MKFQLRIMPRANADVQQIFDYLAEKAPDGAHRWYLAFEAAAQRILVNPSGRPRAREDVFVEETIHAVPFKTRRGRTYRIVFTVVDPEVRILRVRGPGQPDLTPDELHNT